MVADLDAVPPEQLAELGVPVIGFYQHTDIDTKARAEAAGLGDGGSAEPDGPGAAGARRASARLRLGCIRTSARRGPLAQPVRG